MKKSIRKLFFIIVPMVVALSFLPSCSGQKGGVEGQIDGFPILIEYLESKADFINQEETPFFINAPVVFQNLKNNYLVIDIRPLVEFQEAQIQGSVNVLPSEIVSFFENKIHAPSFERIVLVCNAGDASAFIAMGMRYLGYMNVFPMRYGLSSWDMEIAENFRIKNISDSHSEKLVKTGFPKNPPGDFPVLKTIHSNGYDILRERIIDILSNDIDHYLTAFDQYLAKTEEFYVVSYWPKDRYENGHLGGSIRYQPRLSLKLDQELNTLPTEKQILLQCYSGNNSNFVSMYLNILGYNARSLQYGANNFDYTTMKREEPPGRHFAADKDVFNFPLVRKSDLEFQIIAPIESIEPIIKPQGGC